MSGLDLLLRASGLSEWVEPRKCLVRMTVGFLPYATYLSDLLYNSQEDAIRFVHLSPDAPSKKLAIGRIDPDPNPTAEPR